MPFLPENLDQMDRGQIKEYIIRFEKWYEYLAGEYDVYVDALTTTTEIHKRVRDEKVIYYGDQKPAAVREAMVDSDPAVMRAREEMLEVKITQRMLKSELKRLSSGLSTMMHISKGLDGSGGPPSPPARPRYNRPSRVSGAAQKWAEEDGDE